jgi:hypothetical protein
MGRYLLVLLAACSYTPPGATSDDHSTPEDSSPVEPDAPLDTPVVPPDTMPPDGPVVAQTTDHVATSDTWIDSVTLNQDTNFNGSSFLLTDGGPPAVSLLRFDLTGIATTATVSAVELHIFTTNDPGSEVVVFPMLEAWVENEATWNRRTAATAWSAQGAAPPSRGTTAIATFTPGTAFTEFTSDVDTETVQGWVTTPESNLGIAITSVNADGPKFSTRGSMNFKPFLRITHAP